MPRKGRRCCSGARRQRKRSPVCRSGMGGQTPASVLRVPAIQPDIIATTFHVHEQQNSASIPGRGTDGPPDIGHERFKSQFHPCAIVRLGLGIEIAPGGPAIGVVGFRRSFELLPVDHPGRSCCRARRGRPGRCRSVCRNVWRRRTVQVLAMSENDGTIRTEMAC